MMEPYQPGYRLPGPPLDLGDVLEELGHTPESFARIVGRTASGLRRAIRGGTTMSSSMARDVIEGLQAEGWQGDPRAIWQLQKALPGAAMDRVKERYMGSSPEPASQRAQVSRALAELMRHLGRKEVDRVYRSVFGARPNEKE